MMTLVSYSHTQKTFSNTESLVFDDPDHGVIRDEGFRIRVSGLVEHNLVFGFRVYDLGFGI